MESVHPPTIKPPPAVVSTGHKASQLHQQKSNTMREDVQGLCYAKMERVTEWVAECAAARQVEDTGAFLACDGETEDLLLQVLIARPKYQGIPTVEEIQQFAGQLRAYNARLWTLGMTKGFFRMGAAAGELGWVPEYPDDIDSIESMSMQEEEAGVNWMVHEKRVFVRKISPAEEELRDEMIQEYRNIRRHSVNDNKTTRRCRRRSASANNMDMSGKMDTFVRDRMAASNADNQVLNMAC